MAVSSINHQSFYAAIHTTQVVLGQQDAVAAVSAAVRLWRMGLLQSDHRPAASFVFRGPHGSGKSLMSKVRRKIWFAVLATVSLQILCLCVWSSLFEPHPSHILVHTHVTRIHTHFAGTGSPRDA